MDKTLTVSEMATWLKISRTKAYEMTNSGEIPSVKVGRSVRVRIEDLEAWLEKKASGE